MAKERTTSSGAEPTISIIAPGTRITGEMELEGSVRVEGLIEGSIRAGKAVVVSKDGVVEGDIFTQDAVIAGTVRGLITAESRLEVQGSARIHGDVRARRMQLEEGAELNGTVQMGEPKAEEEPAAPAPRSGRSTKEAESGTDTPEDEPAPEPEAAQ